MIIPVNIPGHEYEITLRNGCLSQVGSIFNLNRKVLIVTDSGVPSIYSEIVKASCENPVTVVLPQGEASKNIDNFTMLNKTMIDNNFTRKDAVVAVGGGVCGDIAGFTASCYMRGIDFYNVPTTLLSQVDSSIGGKTAIDFAGIKNIIGSFYQPKAVLIDPDVLETLDSRQFACGMSEIIKMAVCFDKVFFEALEDNEHISLDEIIGRALKIKAYVVEKDEKESGLRKALNFGHTLGHGIESNSGLFHGECVSLGMIAMSEGEAKNRLIEILRREKLPVSTTLDAKEIISDVLHDKKANPKGISSVLVKDVGAFTFSDESKESLMKRYQEAFK